MLKSKYNYIICFLCACLFFLFTSNVYASNDNKPIVDAYKAWKIIFNRPINANKLTKDSIQVKDKNNNLVDAGLRIWPLTNTVLVTPPEKGYNLGEDYTLVITKEVYSDKNKQIKAGESFDFKIKETSEKPIVFKDSAFEKLIRSKVDKPDWEPLYKSDVENITELVEQNFGKKSNNTIKDISGIENLVNLKSLVLTYSQIQDISPLEQLTNLEQVWMYDDEITDVSALEGLTNLKDLDLSYNHITDISSLKKLTNLKYLGLDNNHITDIAPIKGLTDLDLLNLSSNNITDVSPIKNLTNLSCLYLSGNSVTDIEPIKGLINLYCIDLSSNNITDVSAVKDLTNLNSLDIDKNNVTDIRPLEGLTYLRVLRLHDNSANEGYKEVLKEYLPNCDIELSN